MEGLDFKAHYTVAGYNGVAFYLTGYEKIYDEDYEWSGIAQENTDRVSAIMVGDDHVFSVDVADLTMIDENDYCSECGQIGCTADGR